MRTFFNSITAHPRLVIAACLITTALMGLPLSQLATEADVENMLPDDQPSVVHNRLVEETFDIGQNITIALVTKRPEGIYNTQTLSLIDRITKKLQELPGVDPDKTWSLFTVTDIIADQSGFAVVPLCETVPESTEEITRLRNRIENNPLLYGSLVSIDGAGTMINAVVLEHSDKAEIYYNVLTLLDQLPTDKEQFFVTGHPVVQGVIGKHVDRDMRKMMPLVSVVIILMLFIIFKSLRGVLLPLTIVALSVVWALGLMAFFKIPIYPMTTIVPIVIMAIGVADGIHVITRYYEGAKLAPNQSGRKLTIEVMMEMWSPVVMTSLTTTVGFLSLLTSSMKPIFYTGVFTAIGVLTAMIFSLTLLPAFLSLLKVPQRPTANRWWHGSDILFERIGLLVYRMRLPVLALVTGIVVISVVGLYQTRVDSNPMANFNQSDPIPISTKLINRVFSGSMVLHATLTSTEKERFVDPEVLCAIDNFQKTVSEIPLIGATDSVADLLKMMHRAMNEDDPAYFTTPPDRRLAATYLMLHSGDNLDHYINYDRDKTNVQIRVKTGSTQLLEQIISRVEAAADKHLRSLPGISVTVGGMGAVLVDLINIIVYGQIYSILLSILGVFLITTIMFRSPVAGLLNILPISLATGINFGVMGLFDIALEPATAITSCIGIGVGIDFAIHFISKFRLISCSGVTGPELFGRSMSTAGRAIFFNAAVVIGGFMVLLASSFPPSRHMGFMISLNMSTSFLAAVTILPILLIIVKPRFCQKKKSGISK